MNLSLFMKRTSWVIVLLDNKILLGLRSNNINNGNLWNLFGGNIDSNETPKQAATRELYEESGIKVKSKHVKRFKFLFDYEGKYFYELRLTSEPPILLNDETSKVRWFKHSKLTSRSKLHKSTLLFFNKV